MSPKWHGPLWAVDPGDTCGWALWSGETFVGAGECPWRELLHRISQALPQGGIYVVEDYQSWPGSAPFSRLTAVQVIGVLRWLAGDHRVVLQPPSAKIYFLRKDLRSFVDLGGLKLGEHARDAVMHGLYWLRFGKKPACDAHGRPLSGPEKGEEKEGE